MPPLKSRLLLDPNITEKLNSLKNVQNNIFQNFYVHFRALITNWRAKVEKLFDLSSLQNPNSPSVFWNDSLPRWLRR